MRAWYRRGKSGWLGKAAPAVVFVLLLALAIAAFGGVESRSADEQAEVLKTALQRAAVTCYAVEGRYPDTLEELVEAYGVVIDENLFIVSYDAFASNILPDMRVIRKGAKLS